MSPWLFWLCTKAGYLNRIPRYGRTYSLRVRADLTEQQFTNQRGEPAFWGPPRWTWRKRGDWGFTVLERLGIKDRYWDEYDRRKGLP
jgi:hypothetical protein